MFSTLHQCKKILDLNFQLHNMRCNLIIIPMFYLTSPDTLIFLGALISLHILFIMATTRIFSLLRLSCVHNSMFVYLLFYSLAFHFDGCEDCKQMRCTRSDSFMHKELKLITFMCIIVLCFAFITCAYVSAVDDGGNAIWLMEAANSAWKTRRISSRHF